MRRALTQFKSQAIDTPGVIERVSMLFRGQPSLIQGFNTFLPPGYRIECSVDQNDANMITVTTPSGTTTQSLGGHGIAGAINRMTKSGADAGAPPPHEPPMPPGAHEYEGGAAPRAMHGAGPGAPERPPPPPGALHARPPSPGPMGAYGAPPGPMYDGARGAGVPPPGPSSAPGDGVRPPVEFNHAINYVNKIKQRFSGEPDTYKQFLEILQTYQKEQRPIHEVYAQVTVLFDHAQDLLDEFKQFLPDTGAHGGAGASGGLFGMLGHVTNGMAPPAGAEAGAPVPAYDALPPRHGAPPGAGRKKRSVSGVEDAPLPPDAAHGAVGMGKSASSRAKRSKHAKGDAPRAPGAPYGLHGLPPGEVPEMYGPPVQGVAPGYELPPDAPPGYLPGGMYEMPPYAPPHVLGGAGVMQLPHMASIDEVAFFERVKKHIDDRATYLDFLKLLNLYTQDVIDLGTLVDRVSLFLGGQPELVAAFKALCGYDMGKHGWLEHEEPVLENVPALERERVDLNTQRSYGPSYRKLPDSEINLSCSGRDPLCWEVLNDAWVSHPTWASEGESFNPHKKNVYEDALYRSEEERHEYDYHIEANLRTIALLEPIAARIAIMDADERASFRLKPGLGGQSKSIYQRIIKKVYGRNHGLEVIAALHDNPSVAVPVVLARLKQKDEEWKRAQREWNKVWREVDARNFYKALDHQGINFKSADKKTITTKAFVNEIETLRTEQQQRRLALDPSLPALAPRFQLSYALRDGDVLADVLRLAVHFADRAASGFSASEKERIVATLRQLLPRLLGVSPEAFTALVARKTDDDEGSAAPTDDDDDAEGDAPRPTRGGRRGSTSGGASRAEGTSAADLRRAALRNHAEASAQTADDEPRAPASTWHVNTSADAAPSRAPAPVPENVALFANTTLYVFVRLLQLLYARLAQLKTHAADLARETPEAWTKVNPLAAELGLMDTAHGPAGLVSQVAATLAARRGAAPEAEAATGDAAVMQLSPSQYYDVLLELVARLFDHEIDQATFEEAVRFMYGIHGYRAMTLDKVVHAFVKTALTISTDAKCQELLGVFDATQHALHALRTGDAPDTGEARDVQVYKRLIAARMDAEQVLGRDEHLFRIEMAREAGAADPAAIPAQTMHIQLLSHDDLTLEDPRDEEQRWLQYIASYCLYAPTEGLPAETVAPLLRRNLPAAPESADAPGTRYVVRNALDIRVCLRTYRLFFVQGTEDVFARVHPAPRDDDAAQKTDAARRRRWHAWLDARRAVIDERVEPAERDAEPKDAHATSDAREPHAPEPEEPAADDDAPMPDARGAAPAAARSEGDAAPAAAEPGPAEPSTGAEPAGASSGAEPAGASNGAESAEASSGAEPAAEPAAKPAAKPAAEPAAGPAAGPADSADASVPTAPPAPAAPPAAPPGPPNPPAEAPPNEEQS